MESALQHQIITLEDCGPVSVFVQVYKVANIVPVIYSGYIQLVDLEWVNIINLYVTPVTYDNF